MSGIKRRERRWRRHRRRVKVTLRHSTSYTVDLGCGGFCVELLRVLAPGSIVAGTVHERQSDVRFSGTVAWAKPGDPYLGLRGRMGVRFTTVDSAREAPAWLTPETDPRAMEPS